MPTISLAGVDMHLEDRGRGLPVVLLHGFPMDGRMWEGQLSSLSDAYRVIVPDLRGFGGSRDDKPFTIESLADDVHAILKHLNALPAVVGGLSMGGYVALAYAKKYPADLRGLMLMDTKASADNDEQRQGRDKMIQTVRTGGAKAVAEQMLPKMVARDISVHRPQARDALKRMLEECPAKTIEHALVALRDRPDRTGELGAIKVPALVLVGDNDQITPPDVAKKMADAIPKSQYAEILGAGHLAPFEQSAQTNRIIRKFLADHLPAD